MWSNHAQSEHALSVPQRPRRIAIVLCCILLVASFAGSLAACADRSQIITGDRVSHPFLVILCEASDNTTPLAPLSSYQKLFTDSSADLDNVYNFFLDQSYGAIDLASTTILDWTRVPTSAATPTDTAALRALRRQTSSTLGQACADAAKSKVDHWAKYQSGGVIAIWNVSDIDSGASCCVQEDGMTFPYVSAGANPALGGADPTTIAFFTHEMTHDLGVNHAHGPNNGATHLITTEADAGATHTFGAITNFEEYGDCWSIMGCGAWTFDTGGFGAAGPGLSGAERAVFRWTPSDKNIPNGMLTYDSSETDTKTVQLAPRGTPAVPGKLLIKIPIAGQGYYTVEYVEQSGWDRGIPLKHAVLIHEERDSDPSVSYLVARDIYGAWLPGQVFLDPVNHVRVSIDHFDDALNTPATVTLSRDGSSDDGSSRCDPPGYDFEPTSTSAPNIILEAPLDGAHAVAGIPITLQANVTQLVGHGDVTTGSDPLPESQISWTAKDTPVGTGSSVLHTFASPGDYTIKVSAYNKYCLSNSKSATLHVDAPAPSLPSVAITQPVDGTVYYVNPPDFMQHLSLVASGTSNIATFTWTDTLTGFLGTGQDLPVNLKLTATGNCAQQSDTITVRGSTSTGTFSTASITVYLKSTNCIR